MFSCPTIDDIRNVKITENELLYKIFDFETDNRGDKRGRGELVILFLVQNAKFSTIADIESNGSYYEVKAYEKNAPITFGVQNILTRHKFGDILYRLISKVYRTGLNNEEFQNMFPWWFDEGENERNTWFGVPRALKMRSMEISSEEISELPEEIEQLKGYIKNPYVDDISEFEKDLKDFNNEFKDRLAKILLFIKGNLESTNAEYHVYSVTQARIKMKLY
jgi:hypothetical protein